VRRDLVVVPRPSLSALESKVESVCVSK